MSWRAELAALRGAIRRADPVAGGEIHDAYRVELADGSRVFVKTHADPTAGMYAAEAAGLAWLGEGPLRVPRVVACTERWLALEWLELGRAIDEARFGRELAQLHALGAPAFGHATPNFLATLPQDNTAEPDVATFFVERRLRPLVPSAQHARLDALRARPDRFGPPERPARLHGDLWWGNVASCDGAPVIFDPAVYGGHREIDLAMLALFGGLGARVIAGYEEVWPLAEGWRERVALWQLYPVAAHARMFGGAYQAQLVRMLVDVAS